MEYKQFVVKAFEREPGKWRASVERANGKALLKAIARRRRALDKFITGMDATAAEAAMRMAMAAIDANAFSRISYRDRRQARTTLNDMETRGERADARTKDVPAPVG
jgi:Mn-dependent DtxR family transcriptional regulator